MKQIQAALMAKRSQASYRELRLPGAGLDFYSNDYLGLAKDAGIRAGLSKYLEEGRPISSVGSRLLGGNLEVHEACETFLAQAFHAEAALLFSAGYLANLAVMDALGGEGTIFFSDEKNHASLIDGMRLSRKLMLCVFKHNDANDLAKKLAENDAGRKVIVTESVFSMDGDLAPLKDFYQLAEQFQAWLVVDEAHATGVHGRGLAPPNPKFPLVSVHTGGKALAAMGAFVTCPREMKEWIVNQSRAFIFTTALSPLVVKQLELGVKAALTNPGLGKACLDRASQLRNRLGLPSVQSPIIPHYIAGNAEVLQAAQNLQNRGFDLRAVRAPTVAMGEERLRISIKAFHSEFEINSLASALEELSA